MLQVILARIAQISTRFITMVYRSAFRNPYRRLQTISCLLLLAWPISCSDGDPPENKIRSMIGQAVQAAKERDLKSILNLVSEDYSDDQGNTIFELRGILALHFRQNRSIHLLHRVKNIKLRDPDIADVTVVVAMAGQPIASSADLRHINADLLRFDFIVKNENGNDWRVMSAKWEPADLVDFLQP